MAPKTKKIVKSKPQEVKEEKVKKTKKESEKIKEKNKVQKKVQEKKEEEKQDTKEEKKQKVAVKSKKIKKTVEKVEEEEEERQYLSYEELMVETQKKLKEATEKLKQKIKLDKKQLNKCIQALLKYQAKEMKEDILQNDDQLLYLEVILSTVPKQYNIRPQQLYLPHPIYSSTYSSQFCVFSADPQRTFKDKIQNMQLHTLAKVVGHQKLFKKYPTYFDKRKLANQYDLFFADHTIYSLINKLYGKAFYERKKIPFAINCTQVPADLKDKFGDDYEAYLNDLANHTYFSQGNGPVYTFKVGRTDMTPKQLQANIEAIVYSGIACIIKDDQNVDTIHSINIKTNNSPSLPFFNMLSQAEIEAYKKK